VVTAAVSTCSGTWDLGLGTASQAGNIATYMYFVWDGEGSQVGETVAAHGRPHFQ
jgi:hypothetical protein